MHWRFWEPKHTVESVARRLAEGLRDGSIVLDDPLDDETPDSKAEIFFNRGAERQGKGNLEGALECFKKITEIEGAHPVWVIRALINSSCDKRALGDLGGAVHDASLAVKMPDATAADRAAALVNRGAAWHALGEHSGAVRDYSQVIDDPGSPLDAKVAALTGRALLREFTLSDFPGALSDLLAVRELDPQTADTLAADIARCGAQIADDSGPRTADIRGEAARGDELNHMSDEQLELTLMEMVKKLFHLRFQSATGRLEAPAEMQRVKSDFARTRAILRERQNDAHRQKLAHAARQGEGSSNAE